MGGDQYSKKIHFMKRRQQHALNSLPRDGKLRELKKKHVHTLCVVVYLLRLTSLIDQPVGAVDEN